MGVAVIECQVVHSLAIDGVSLVTDDREGGAVLDEPVGRWNGHPMGHTLNHTHSWRGRGMVRCISQTTQTPCDLLSQECSEVAPSLRVLSPEGQVVQEVDPERPW